MTETKIRIACLSRPGSYNRFRQRQLPLATKTTVLRRTSTAIYGALVESAGSRSHHAAWRLGRAADFVTAEHVEPCNLRNLLIVESFDLE